MINGSRRKTVPFSDKAGMSINTEGKHDDREPPGVNFISFSKAQEACSAGFTPLSLSGTCAPAQQKPCPLGGSREPRGKVIFRIQEEGPLAGSLGPSPVDPVTCVSSRKNNRMLELQASTDTSSIDSDSVPDGRYELIWYCNLTRFCKAVPHFYPRQVLSALS